MPNGGSDCCGTCWFNRSNSGQRGSVNFNRDIPSFCEIRQLAIPNPFYTYCANHPYHRPNRDPIPIGPVYTFMATTMCESSGSRRQTRRRSASTCWIS